MAVSLAATGLLVGVVALQQSWVTPAAAGVDQSSRFDCVGFDTNASGRPQAVITMFNTSNDATVTGTLRWYNTSGDSVGDSVDVSINNHETQQFTAKDPGIIRAKIKLDGPAVVDGRMVWLNGSSSSGVAVTCK
jgi:hypothetical protein